MTTLDSLWAISPVDGRYRKQTEELAAFFSEGALIRYRLRVETEYFIALCRLPLPQLKKVPANVFPELRKTFYEQFSLSDASRVKEIESTTNHDVKAVEYFMKEKFDALGLAEYKEFIHFGLTSQDINNTAIPLLLREAFENVLRPLILEITIELEKLADEWQHVPMLAHTHGQPASPTRVGKEIRVFTTRIRGQRHLLEQVPFSAKFSGASGNFNAHHIAYPQVDWKKFGDTFVSSLGLVRTHPTTQIEPYDNLAAFFDGLKRINTIFIDFARDIWQYIAMNYFRQKVKEGEVGSSAMPHKVNPIDFENAEGNFGFANALFEYMSAKLPVSRLQRDLTDSTVLRNIGIPFAHTLIALKSLRKGTGKLILNEAALLAHLDENWSVVAEAIQTVLRREGHPNPYEALKELTRGNVSVTKESLHRFIDTLKIADAVKAELKNITPRNYTGI
ncbi:MAG TPA: adenylosuccinate lyase [Bacteroidia bacterium]|nr:adenylosuccinate lyase [Bacteroidia bacterium]